MYLLSQSVCCQSSIEQSNLAIMVLSSEIDGELYRLSLRCELEIRDVTKFEFEFDNVRTSNVFKRLEI